MPNETLSAGGNYTHLDAKFVRLVRLAFGDAFDFRRMHAVHLAFVVTLLRMNAPGNLQQPREPGMFLFPLYWPSHHFAFDVTHHSAQVDIEPLLFAPGTLHLPGMGIASVFAQGDSR